MRIVVRLILSSLVVMFAAAPARMALAAEAIMLRAGGATGPNAVFAFDKGRSPTGSWCAQPRPASPDRGSRSSSTRPERPRFATSLRPTECKFGDSGSKCEVIVPASSPAYAAILAQFKRGRVARVTVDDAGAMKMDQTASLKGFTKSLR